MQKSYIADFLTKKRVMNEGEIQQFYIEDDYEAIIEPWIWECVQLEMERRKRYLEEHGTNSYSHNMESNSFASKVVCRLCNWVFARKGWQSKRGEIRRIWQCGERYKARGVFGCGNRHVEENTLEKAFVMAWNGILENGDYFWEKWEKQKKSENLLEVYQAMDFQELAKSEQPLEKMETDFMLRVLDHIKVSEDGTLMLVFLDGTEIECRGEK